MTSVCQIEGCGKRKFARGWCSAHYARWQDHGDPLKGVRDHHKSPSDLPDSIAKLYIDDLWSSPQIAKQFACSTWSVNVRLRELGVALRPRGNSKGSRYKTAVRHIIPKETLRALYLDQSLSAEAIGERFSCSMPTVLERLRAANIPIRVFGEHRKGQKPHNFDPTISHEERIIRRNLPEMFAWRRAVYARDHFTCVCCGKRRGAVLNAHHLASYRANPSQRFEISNGVTLCRECHIDFHKRYGWGNNTPEQFVEYMQSERIAA